MKAIQNLKQVRRIKRDAEAIIEVGVKKTIEQDLFIQ
jgi:hypothetical protein